MDIFKLATEFSVQVTEYEKSVAKKALIAFKHVEKNLENCINHLNIIYTSFKDNPEVPPEDILKARAALRRYRDKVVDNFNEFKIISFKSLYIINMFGVDPEINKLKKIFIEQIEQIQTEVNQFAELFANLSAKDFAQSVIKECEQIIKASDELKKLINDRISDHIKQNILASSWADEMSQEMKINLNEPDPVIIKLVNNRDNEENAVNNSISI